MSTSPPSTLGKYQIIREIARSNDIVYEAYDPLMHRRVALKELFVPGGSTSQQRDERLRRFQREVKAAGSLSHPNIVTVYEVGQDGDRHYMAMEFLDGHTLRNEIDTHGFLPGERAIEIAIEVLNGLEFAHKHGVVHRDIKPDNIQLLEDGRVKLTDFGIARLTFEPNLTMDGQVFGTPSYMSPEQVVGKEIDARSDLFGLGVVLYEMLAGAKPFTGDNVIAITYAITNTHPSQPAQISGALWQVIQKAIDKTPAMRYATAAEMRAALETAVAQPAAAPVPPPVDPYALLAQQFPNAMAQYTQPYVPAPPAQYPYNPYQTPSPVGQPYQPYSPSPMPNVPIYYPPPRRPMVSDHTKNLLARFFLTLLVVGLLFGLIIYGIMALVGAASGNARSRSAPPPVAAPGAFEPIAGPSDRTPRRSARSSRQPVDRAIPESDRPTPYPPRDYLYGNAMGARIAAERHEQDQNWEDAGLAYAEAYEFSRSEDDAQRAMRMAERLAAEGPGRHLAARRVLQSLKDAGYRSEALDRALDILG